MKFALVLLGAVFCLSTNAIAASFRLDDARLYSCGGAVDLRESVGGDLHLQVNARECSNLIVEDQVGREIRTYKMPGTQGNYGGSYTLSSEMRGALARGGLRLVVRSNSGKHLDTILVRPGAAQPSWRTALPLRWEYTWSTTGRCFLYSAEDRSIQLMIPQACIDRVRTLPDGWSYRTNHFGQCYLSNEYGGDVDPHGRAVDSAHCRGY